MGRSDLGRYNLGALKPDTFSNDRSILIMRLSQGIYADLAGANDIIEGTGTEIIFVVFVD